ncbi:MAG: hypothetical protein ACHP9Y_04085, partial [Gammaproteobacteria bacterium]
DWYQWLKKYSGAKAKPPTVGNKNYPALEDAPGSYVVRQIGIEQTAGSKPSRTQSNTTKTKETVNPKK